MNRFKRRTAFVVGCHTIDGNPAGAERAHLNAHSKAMLTDAEYRKAVREGERMRVRRTAREATR